MTESGLKVDFGRLGTIDVGFTPTRTLNSTEPAEGCVGAPRTLREGIFAGTIDFTGERGFVRLEGPQAEGSMSVISQWQCPDESLAPFAGLPALLARDSQGKAERASLYAARRHCSCLFGAIVRTGKQGGSVFYGAKVERREGMKIFRITSVRSGPSAFVFDPERETVSLRPPRPLRGNAFFEAGPPEAEGLWRSNIRVPLPGASPLPTDGPGFKAVLQFD